MRRSSRPRVSHLASFPPILLALCACSATSDRPVAPAAPASATAAPAPAATSALADAGAADPAARAEDLLRRMTLEEKIDYLGGDRGFYIRAVPRLGIPEIKMSDGPAGVRNWGPSTAYPAPIALAATFDPAAAERVGASIGRDARARGVHILLAPGVNIQRGPLAGRNFEYLGEDPFLAGSVVTGYIRGVQSEGVLATVKHFAGNNQEWDRNHVSSEIDERTLREIYLPAFERAVREAKVGALMTAYNLLNGTYCSHHAFLNNDVLKREWGFAGFVMSDWGAVHDGLGAAQGGLDLEMPSAKGMNRETLLPLLAAHRIDEAVLDDKVRRILRTVIAAGFFDRPQQRDVPLDDPASHAVALEAAEKSLVLLKNEARLLPLDRAKDKRIAVLGPNADPAVYGGSGSALVTPFHAVSLLEGVRQVAPGAEVLYHPGVRRVSEVGLLGTACFAGPVRQQIFAGEALAGPPLVESTLDRIDFHPSHDGSPAKVDGKPLPGEHYSIRWTGTVSAPKAGRYQIVVNGDDGVRVLVDKHKVVEDWTDHAPIVHTASLELHAGPHQVIVEYYQGIGGAVAQFGFGPELPHPPPFEHTEEVSALAKRADAVVVAVGFGQTAATNAAGAPFQAFWPESWARQAGLVETEDSDRPFALPAAELETIRLALQANPRTVVVVYAGAGVDLAGFTAKTPSLLWAFYPGQEGGRAVAEAVFGDVNPSGKLPFTLAKRYEDHPSAPYYSLNQNQKTPYTEGVFVGYRGFDAKQVEPLFPFGYGMSYTTFAYSDLHVEPAADGSAKVRFRVENVGARAGDEIAEVYVAPPPESVPRPPVELKGTARVSLGPGARQEVSLSLDPRAFAYWSPQRHGWTVEAGAFEIRVGTSSREVRLRQKIDVTARSLP
jgi:beta-glucosidase